jgi:hypothetical protein
MEKERSMKEKIEMQKNIPVIISVIGFPNIIVIVITTIATTSTNIFTASTAAVATGNVTAIFTSRGFNASTVIVRFTISRKTL